MAVAEYLTTKQVGELLGVTADKVVDWIACGDLAAINVARVRGVRARWRISREALEAFLTSRGNRASTPTPRAARRQTDAAVTKYF
jgi:excisionase family DNA binding protein